MIDNYYWITSTHAEDCASVTESCYDGNSVSMTTENKVYSYCIEYNIRHNST